MNQIKEAEQEIFSIWQEARGENTSVGNTPAESAEKFRMLPDGNYTGRVYIQPDIVADDRSLNYGRRKFVIQILPIGAESEDELCITRVLLPYYLATPSPDSDPNFNKWRGAVKTYLRETDRILEKCGVDISETDMSCFVQQIGRSNLSRPDIEFTFKNEVATVNRVISRENEEALNSELESLPDGNDAPF